MCRRLIFPPRTASRRSQVDPVAPLLLRSLKCLSSWIKINQKRCWGGGFEIEYPQYNRVLQFGNRRVFWTKFVCLCNYPTLRNSAALNSNWESMAQRHGCTRCGTGACEAGSWCFMYHLHVYHEIRPPAWETPGKRTTQR